MTTVTTTIEFYNGTTWADITADVLAGSLSWGGGIRGSGPTDRVAVPGKMELKLKNGQNNSAGLIGYYSPDHANKRTGWELGAKIRVKLVSGGNTRYWMYRINDIKPVPGKYEQRSVDVAASDYIHELSKRKVSGLAIQSEKRSDQLFTILMAALPFAPTNTSFDTGAFYYSRAFHDERDEGTYSLTVAQKICQSDLSYFFQDGDSTDGETLHFQSHKTRQSNYTSVASFNDAMSDLEITRSNDDIWNHVTAQTYPVEVEAELSVLGSVVEEFALEPGESRTIQIPYLDETTEQRISGENLQTPEANTDYRMSSIEGNGGNDMNINLSITPTYGANTLSAVVLNTHASQKGYVNQLRVRGNKVKVNNKIGSLDFNQASIDAYGEKSITFNMPYQSNAVFGLAVAKEIVRRYKSPLSNVSGITFIANRNSTLMGYALTCGIGSRITVTETVTGINFDFFINGFQYELDKGGVLSVTWTLERAFNTEHYFTTDDNTYGVTNSIYKTAPF